MRSIVLGSKADIRRPIATSLSLLLVSQTLGLPLGWGGPQIAAQPPPYAPFNYYSLLDPWSLRAEIERRHLEGGTVAERLERLTRGLVAAPYLLSALGEASGRDPDPRMRFDAFDCTTFVETALALLHCDDPDAIRKRMDFIRYTDGEVGFLHRRHLMTSQWIPQLVAAGVLEDVTEQVGKDKTKHIRLALTERRWKHRRVARSLELGEGIVPVGEFDLPYIPIAHAQKIVASFPAGAVVNVVRADVPGSPDVITHQGLLIRKPGDDQLYVRHASPVSKRVIDEPFARMLWRYTKPRKWPIVGVNILAVVPVEDPPREETADLSP